MRILLADNRIIVANDLHTLDNVSEIHQQPLRI